MIKRLGLTCILVGCFLTFYYFIPFRIFSFSPILFSGIFSLATIILAGLTIFNIGGPNELKLFLVRVRKMKSLLSILYIAAIFSFIGLFFLYLFKFIASGENEFAFNSKETRGVIIDKWNEETTRRFTTYRFTYIKVKYLVDNNEVISEHLTSGDFLTATIPDIGQSITVYYAKSNPKKFETDWEKQIREHEPMRDPENVRRKMFLDSVLKARER